MIKVNSILSAELTAAPRVKAQIKKGNSIIKPSWIHESIKRNRLLPLFKEYAA